MKKIPGIQILPHKIGPVSIASLATLTAQDLTTNYDSEINRSLLLKHVRANLVIKAAVDEEFIIVGMARGEASVTGIKNALESVQLTEDLETQAVVRDVFMETLMMMGDPASIGLLVEIDVSLGGGKGIPVEEDEGVKWFAYNPDDGNLSAGSQEVIGMAVYNGIWL